MQGRYVEKLPWLTFDTDLDMDMNMDLDMGRRRRH